MSKMNIYKKIQLLNNTDKFINVLKQIFELHTQFPKRFEIGYEENFTLYIKDGKEKKPILYICIENKFITIQDEDKCGNQMDYDLFQKLEILTQFSFSSKAINNSRKLFFKHISTESDIEQLYTALLSI